MQGGTKISGIEPGSVDGPPDAPSHKPPKSRKRRLLLGCALPLAVVIALLALGSHLLAKRLERVGRPAAQGPQPAWVPAGKRFVPWASYPIVYDGPGRLDAYEPYSCREGAGVADPALAISFSGKAVRCRPGLVSQLVPSPRQLLVHLPAGYDQMKEPLPLVISLHGFGQRPAHVFAAFVNYLDAAEASGKMPKAVTAFPDFSLGGDGLDNPASRWDENSGSWGVNSSIGRYQDYFWQDVLPFLTAHYRLSDNPAKTVVLGGSMGGTMALNIMLDEPRRFPNVGAFYPALDLRYSCNGDRLAPYRPDCYKPLVDNVPDRRMTTMPGLKGRVFVERFVLYPIFDAGALGGPRWNDGLAMWQRIRRRNPLDRLRDEKPNLAGVHFWYVVGDRDDFNIYSEVPEFDKEATKLGMIVEPADHVRPGKHDLDFFREHVDEALAWVAQRLKN
jgi:S-formylglutathione hydrolase FrmB